LDPHTVGEILKSFLRSLPHPIVPVNPFYPRFMVATTIENEKHCALFLGAVVALLPEERRQLLRYLCHFFNQIIEYSAENKMGASNLAIIFSPAFFGQYVTMDSTLIVAEAKATSKITQCLIENFTKIFASSHTPLETMVASESFSEGQVSFLKGEEVDVIRKTGAEDACYVVVNGLLKSVSYSSLLNKCTPLSNRTASSNVSEEQDQAAREEALEKFLGCSATSSDRKRISSSTYIPAGQKAAAERDRVIAVGVAATELKTSKKNHLRRKSTEMLALLRRESEDDKLERKDKEKDKDKEKEKEKEKKKRRAPTSWASHASTKSSNSFFGGLPSLGRKRSSQKSPSRELNIPERFTRSSASLTPAHSESASSLRLMATKERKISSPSPASHRTSPLAQESDC